MRYDHDLMTSLPLGELIPDFLDQPRALRTAGIYLFRKDDAHLLANASPEEFAHTILRDATSDQPGRVAIEVIGLDAGEVFSATHASVSTYVRRKNAAGRTYDGLLSYSLHHPGRHFVISGPSKIGKTQLWRAVIGSDAIAIPCTGHDTLEDLYATALYKSEHPYTVTERTVTSHRSSESQSTTITLGSEMLAASVGDSHESEDLTERERAYAFQTRPQSAAVVAEALARDSHVLVLENFHRIDLTSLGQLAVDMRAFSDSGVSVVLVGIPDDPYRICQLNPELSGRTEFLRLPHWTDTELRSIATNGERALNVTFPEDFLDLLVGEAAGSPLLMQQLSHLSCLAVDVTSRCDSLLEINIRRDRFVAGVRAYLGPSLAPYSQYDIFLREQADESGLPTTFVPALQRAMRMDKGDMVFDLDTLELGGVPKATLTAFSSRHSEDPRTGMALHVDPSSRSVAINDPLFYAYTRWFGLDARTSSLI